MQISSFRRKIFSVNSQLSKEINFEILFRNLEHSILRNFSTEISLMELWLVSQRVFRNFEWSVDDVGFRKFISDVKMLTFERKILQFLFRNRILK